MAAKPLEAGTPKRLADIDNRLSSITSDLSHVFDRVGRVTGPADAVQLVANRVDVGAHIRIGCDVTDRVADFAGLRRVAGEVAADPQRLELGCVERLVDGLWNGHHGDGVPQCLCARAHPGVGDERVRDP